VEAQRPAGVGVAGGVEGRPIARLVPIVEDAPDRVLGTDAGKLVVPDDIDAPLPDDIIDLFEGR